MGKQSTTPYKRIGDEVILTPEGELVRVDWSKSKLVIYRMTEPLKARVVPFPFIIATQEQLEKVPLSLFFDKLRDKDPALYLKVFSLNGEMDTIDFTCPPFKDLLEEIYNEKEHEDRNKT